MLAFPGATRTTKSYKLIAGTSATVTTSVLSLDWAWTGLSLSDTVTTSRGSSAGGGSTPTGGAGAELPPTVSATV